MNRSSGDETERSMDDLQIGIQRTREAISHNLETLGEKLTPENVKEETKEALSEVKDAGIQKLKEVKEQATNMAVERVRAVQDRARDVGIAGADFVRDNALPLAVIGVGLGLFAQNVRSHRGSWQERQVPQRGNAVRVNRLDEEEDEGMNLRQAAREKSEAVRDKTRQTTQAVRDRTRQTTQAVREKARHWTSEGRHWASENTFASSALAMAAGLGLGLLLPTTGREEQLMGGARERLLGEARRTARDIRRAAQETGREVKQAAVETTHH